MRLTLHTDYAFRILIYLAAVEGRLVSASDIAEIYQIPLNHLKKIITYLVKGGYVSSLRGRNGGIKLARRPEDIRLGAVIEYIDEGGSLLRCMDKKISAREKGDFCLLAGGCHLKSAILEAQAVFLEKLNQKTLKDVVGSCEKKQLLRGKTGSIV